MEGKILLRDVIENRIYLVYPSRISYDNKEEIINRLYTKSVSKKLKPQCRVCAGYYLDPVPACYFKEECPLRMHEIQGRIVTQEIRMSPLFLEVNEVGIYLISSQASFTSIGLFSRLLDIFLYNIHNLLGISIHHGNQNPFNNMEENLSAWITKKHSGNTSLHTNNSMGTKLAVQGKVINTSYRSINHIIKEQITRNLNSELILKKSNKKKEYNDLFFSIFLEKENKRPILKELLKINNCLNCEKLIIELLDGMNFARENFTYLYNFPEMRNPTIVEDDPEALDLLYQTQEKCKSAIHKIFNGGIILPKNVGPKHKVLVEKLFKL